MLHIPLIVYETIRETSKFCEQCYRHLSDEEIIKINIIDLDKF
jgi:hypothetical protein